MSYERRELSLSDIEPNNFNPNTMPPDEYSALVQDMKICGPQHDLAIDPIIVAPKNLFYNDPKAEPGRYVIIDGEHRWKAAKELGWDQIPAEIRNLGEDLAKAMNYRRNRQRGHMDPLKEAALFNSETAKRLKKKAIALKYNVDPSYVSKRLGLLQLDKKVVAILKEPEETFKEIETERYEERLAQWEQRQEEGSGHSWMRKPDEPEEEDLLPRGKLSASHLEAIYTLPGDKQVEVAHEVLSKDLNVRATESRVRAEKEDMAKQKRFKEALEKAKRKKCPECGKEPDSFGHNEDQFSCPSYHRWEYMKTAKEVKAEREARKIVTDKKRSEEIKEKFKEARENPRYIRLPENPQELHEKVKPWLLAKLRQLTEIHRINVYGKRGDEVIDLDYDPPGEWDRMKLSLKIGDKPFGFSVERKEYKKFGDKSRVNMYWSIKASEQTRDNLAKFFSETVTTDKDPLIEQPGADISSSPQPTTIVGGERKPPCETCANDGVSCNRERFYARSIQFDDLSINDELVCDSYVEKTEEDQ